MDLDFSNKQNIFRLDNPPSRFLQVLLESFTLTKERDRRVLHVAIPESSRCIVDSAGKRDFFDTLDNAGRRGKQSLKKALDKFHEEDGPILSYHFDCSKHPLRYANGGVLPILRLDRKEYFCLFYRDIFPIGWNIANGASDSVDEMMHPERIILREFGEELLVCDWKDEKLYAFEPTEQMAPSLRVHQAVEAWQREVRRADISKFGRLTKPENRLPMPMKWVSGPDKVTVEFEGQTHTSNGYFVNVTPEDNAIEVDRIAFINLRGDIGIFDGEQSHGRVLNRVVALFERNAMKKALAGNRFVPDILFCTGQKGDPQGLAGYVQEYLQRLRKCTPPARGDKDRKAYDAAVSKRKEMNLCPITRAMIERYFRWSKEEQRRASTRETDHKWVGMLQARRCQVFISHASADAQIAQWLYSYLSAQGLAVFCSEESLPRLGESRFAKAIFEALEAAPCLVVIATKANHFESGWVGFEWSSFLTEILAKRKTEGRIFILGSVRIDEIPFPLRSFQVIPYSPASSQDAFESLYEFLARSLAPLTARGGCPPAGSGMCSPP